MRHRPRPSASLPALLVAALCLPLLVGATTPADPDPSQDAPGVAPQIDRLLDPALDLADPALDLVDGISDALPVPDALDVVIRDTTDRLRTVGCQAPFVLDEVLGCTRPAAGGLVEVVGPDGVVATTHGADIGHPDDGHDHDHREVGAASSSGGLPATRRPVLCARDGSARTVVLYAHLRGQSDRRSTHRATLRETVERSNQAIAASGRTSGGPRTDLRVRCNGAGKISVASVVVSSRSFADVKAAVAAAGYDRRNEKYLVFGDFSAPDPRYAGIADLFLDARRSTNNHNNGAQAMYALVYGAKHFTGPTALHELGHTMGAVQPGAPGADGAGHCSTGRDIMCYPTTSTRCGSAVFDCGNNTYFSTSTRPGEWLHGHWNLGWSGNRFLQQVGTTAPGETFRDTGSSVHHDAIEYVANAGVAGGYADGTYRPSRPVSRAHMAAFLQRARSLPTSGGHPFSDVRGGTHERAIGAVASAKVAQGYPDGTYRPGVRVTRGQMAAFLTRAFDLPAGRSAGFRDTRGTRHEAAIDAVARAGITEGFGDGTFRPHARVTRGQMATFLHRAMR